MRKIVGLVIVIVLALGMFFCGAASVLHSEGFYDAENNQFCVEWWNNAWAWDMPD